MNYKLILLFIVLCSLFIDFSYAQDEILMLNGKRLNTKILKENENEVVCTLPEKKFNFLQSLNKIVNTWSIDLGIGSMLPYGEIKSYNLYPVDKNNDARRVGLFFGITRELNSTIALQAKYTSGELYGEKSGITTVNNTVYNGVYFNADLNEFSISSVFNLDRLFANDYPETTMSAYFKIGIGILFYRTIEKSLDTNGYINSYGYLNNGELYGKMQNALVIPLGIGFNWKLSNSLDLRLEGLMKITNTKKLEADLNEKSNVNYGITSLALSYKLGKSELKNEKTIDKSDIYYISPADGKKIITYKGDSIATVENMGKYIEGEEYAIKNYKPVFSTIGSVATGLVGGYLPFWGILVPTAYVIGTTSFSPAVKNKKGLPEIPYSRLNNKFFVQGYMDKARKIKLKRTVIGSLAGLTAMIIIRTINFEINNK